MKPKTAKAALCKALLAGEVLSIKNCFNTIGITNAPREISRSIEKPFNVIVSKVRKQGKSKYGKEVTWFEYRLNYAKHNMEGINKMIKYVEDNGGF